MMSTMNPVIMAAAAAIAIVATAIIIEMILAVLRAIVGVKMMTAITTDNRLGHLNEVAVVDNFQ
jgi:hypothetical protein